MPLSVAAIVIGSQLCRPCHDPHTNTDKSQAACLSCHAGAHRQQERCVTCHMPKARTIDGNHGVMTDHSIPRTLQTSPPPGAGPLVAFGPAADDRAIGLAYAELQDTRALPYLRRAVPQDWPVRLRLAVLEPDTARATQLYEAVLRNNPHEPATLVNLGALYAQRGSMLRALSFGSERSR